jgi:flagellar protein FlaG
MEAAPILHALDEVSESVIVQEARSLSGTRTQQPVSQPNEEESKEQVLITTQKAADGIAEKMNQVASVFNTSLAFSVDESTGKSVIKVMDKETEEVIRQIPPEEMLRMIGKMRYVMGMLLDVEI